MDSEETRKQTYAAQREGDRVRKYKPNPEECLYHVDPTSFITVMKELNVNLMIPPPHNKRSAMAVCSCRTSRTSPQRMSVTELQIFLADCEISLSDEMLLSRLTDKPAHSETKSTSTRTVQFVEDALHEAISGGKESALRFIVLLKMALKQDFSLLQKEQEIGGSRLQLQLMQKINTPVIYHYRPKITWTYIWQSLPSCWPF